MSDPLSEVVRLMRPRAVVANLVSGKGAWAVRYAAFGLPSFCVVLQGSSRLVVDGHEPLTISAGDFILLPATPAFTLSSFAPAPALQLDPHAAAKAGSVRYGERRGRPDMRSLGGAFEFDGADAALLVALLPGLLHVKGSARLAQLVRMLVDESAQRRPAADFMMSRLVELMLVEALRSAASAGAPPGLLRALADARLARAIGQLHAHVERRWTVAQLAKAAALSRSAFFERFTRSVGVAPMAYLLDWRMQRAKEMLREQRLAIAEVAERVGYGSTSSFSAAFSRSAGLPPSRYARAHRS